MAFNFPDAPTLNQQYGSYKWDGEKWIAYGTPDGPSDGKMYGRKNAAWNRAVDVAGDTMTGSLTITPASGPANVNFNAPAGNQAGFNLAEAGVTGIWQIIKQATVADLLFYETLNNVTAIYANPANKRVNIGYTTASTSPTTGALTVAGGVGVGGDIHGGDIHAARSATQGYVFLGTNAQAHLGFDGSNHILAGPSSNLFVSAPVLFLNYTSPTGPGYIYFNGGASRSIVCDGSNFSLNGGNLTISSTTASTSPTTGALTVAGGVGIGGALFVSGDISSLAGDITARAAHTVDQAITGARSDTYASTFVETALLQYGSAYPGTFEGVPFAHLGQLRFQNTNNAMVVSPVTPLRVHVQGGETARFSAFGTASTSATTGALTVNGGVGISGNLFVGSNVSAGIYYSNGIPLAVRSGDYNMFYDTASNIAMLIGGLGATFHRNTLHRFEGIGGIAGGDVVMSSTTPATSSAAAALAVAGGVGIGGNIYLKPPASATPANNGEMTFQLTSNTALAIKVKGSDGTVRTATLTLA